MSPFYKPSAQQSSKPTTCLIESSHPPLCPLPAILGPAKQSACFSICGERLEVDSIAALRYFVHPPENASLRDGLEKFMKLPVQDRCFQRARRLDNVFSTLLQSQNAEELLEAEVVTWRGIMRKIILGDKIDLNVSYYEGVLYLEEQNLGSQFDNNSESTYMGHKFESLCSTATRGGEPDFQDVDLHTLWNTVITRSFGTLTILLVGEVDCVKDAYAENPGPQNYVELKTRKTENSGPARYYKANIEKWNVQSHLVGTPEIFVGFPDSTGVLRSFDSRPVQDMAYAQSKFDWGARVLHSLRKHCADGVATDGALKVWRVQTRSGRVDIRELDASEVKRMNKGGRARNGILPLSFIRGLEKRKTSAAKSSKGI
ncbi:hypothetical protein B0H10DRAFT_2439227 [Mycena sp. CBHHK59/15]|nr:hypothetical protein B0H10DRAFT_2439227 [Mycena sp. CBHHK59/15]